jgi:hypothetical protein
VLDRLSPLRVAVRWQLRMRLDMCLRHNGRVVVGVCLEILLNLRAEQGEINRGG